MRRKRFTEKDIAALQQMLEQNGAKPAGDWIEVRLQDIAFRFDDDLERRDTDTLAARIAAARSDLDGVTSTIKFLAHWEHDLTAEGISQAAPFVYGAWDEPRHEPVTAEEVAAYIVPPDFTQKEISTTRRVLEHLAMFAASVHGYHCGNRVMSPNRNERPEIDGLVRGLTKLWCAALKIPVGNIKISESAGSQAASFIETGVGILLGKALSRKSIVTRVCAYRDEEKKKLS